MKSVPVNVGMLVSFDYQYLYHSIPRIYEHSDRIVLALDHECRSWTGLKFTIDDQFWKWLKEFDTKNKIEIYRDNFFVPELDAISNDSRERNMLAERMGEGGWYVQVDSDEYFIDFGAFVKFLKQHDHWVTQRKKPIDIGAFLIPLFRQDKDGFLYVKNSFETVVLATNVPDYKRARRSDHYIRYTPHYLFHQTWARTEEEISFKLNSWGHINDFDIQSYFNLWKSIDKNNYKFICNFHPLDPKVWHKLEWGKGKDISEFIANYSLESPISVPAKFYLRKRMGQIYKSWMG
jgi:hypothetical protein